MSYFHGKKLRWQEDIDADMNNMSIMNKCWYFQMNNVIMNSIVSE